MTRLAFVSRFTMADTSWLSLMHHFSSFSHFPSYRFIRLHHFDAGYLNASDLIPEDLKNMKI